MIDESHEELSALTIKTKSVENTLLPLVQQISSLMKLQDCFNRQRTLPRAIESPIRAIGKSVLSAIEKFISIGLSIASSKQESIVKSDMEQACAEARKAGDKLVKLSASVGGSQSDSVECLSGKELTNACRNLLTSITRVLLLADVLVVSEIVAAIDKVALSLDQLSQARTDQDFAQRFAQYGSDMVAVAHHTGDRQADLKDERKRAMLSSSRTILEKFTLLVLHATMLTLPSSMEDHNALYQCQIRETTVEKAKNIRDLVHREVHKNLKRARRIVVDSGATLSATNCDRTKPDNMCKCCRTVEGLINRCLEQDQCRENGLLDISRSVRAICERSVPFLEASFVSHDQRDRIHGYIQQLQTLAESPSDSHYCRSSVDQNLVRMRSIVHQLSAHLENLVLFQATELFRLTDEISVLNEVRNYGLMNRQDMLELCLQRFDEQHESVCELCCLMAQISPYEPLTVACEHHESMFRCLYELICESARLLAMFTWPQSSRTAFLRRNIPTTPTAPQTAAICQLDLFDNLFRYWVDEINEFSVLVKELQDVIEQRTEKLTYFSLPRPGRHGTTGRNAAQSPTLPRCVLHLDSNERSKILRLGAEMRAATNEVDSEAERWDEAHHNEIIRRAKNMSNMAFSMYQFTRNEGSIQCAQDLFAQAGYLIEEGIRLHNAVDRFVAEIPDETHRRQLEQQLDVLPVLCHQLQLRVRLVRLTERRSELLNKIDHVINETRDIMNCVARLVNMSFICYNKYNMSGSCLTTRFDDQIIATMNEKFTSPSNRQRPCDRPYDSNDESSSSCTNLFHSKHHRHCRYKQQQQFDFHLTGRPADDRAIDDRRDRMVDKYPVYCYKTDRV